MAGPMALRRWPCSGAGELQHVVGIIVAQDGAALLADQAPQGGGYGRGHFPAAFRGQGIALPAAEHLAVAGCSELLGFGYQVNVAVVGLPGVIAPGEEAVIDQHHAVQVGRFLDRQAHQLGQLEAGAQVLHDADVVAIDPAQDGVGVLVVGQAHHRVGVGVGDAVEGQEGVEQGFDGGPGRVGVEDAAVKVVHHVLVGHFAALKDGEHPFQFQAGELPTLHGLEVGTGTLDAHDFYVPAQEVLFGDLDGGVAAAPDHQGRVGADEPAHVHQLVQFVQAVGFVFLPEVFHGYLPILFIHE